MVVIMIYSSKYTKVLTTAKDNMYVLMLTLQ